jgi:hypothetical protein
VINKTTGFVQGEINIRLITAAEHTAKLAGGVVVPDETASTLASEDGTKRHFLITYTTRDEDGNAVEATAGELKGQYFFLN